MRIDAKIIKAVCGKDRLHFLEYAFVGLKAFCKKKMIFEELCIFFHGKPLWKRIITLRGLDIKKEKSSIKAT